MTKQNQELPNPYESMSLYFKEPHGTKMVWEVSYSSFFNEVPVSFKSEEIQQ